MKQDWRVKKLGDVCEIVNGSTPLRTKKEFWENGDFPWFTIDDIREQGRIIKYTKQKVTRAALKKLRVIPPDSILICCTASIGEYAITKIELTTNQQFNGLVIKNKKEIHPVFLLYFCSTLKETLSNLSGKTTIDFIPISRLKEIEIPLPPFDEQKRIVVILDKAFEAISKAKDNAKQNLKNSKELFESYLQDMFNNSNNDWKIRRMDDLCEIELGKTPYRGDRTYWDKEKQGNNVWLSIADLLNTDGDVVSDSKEYITDKATKISKIVKKGTLLVSFKLTLGRLAFAGRDLFTNEAIAALSLKDEKIIDKYFLYQFLSFFDWNVATDGDVKVKGRTLNKAKLKQIEIPIPPILEQKTIVKKLKTLSSETKKLESVYQQKINDLEELKKSILQKAFNGELKNVKV